MEPWLVFLPDNETSYPLLNPNESDFPNHNNSMDKGSGGWSAAQMQRIITLSILMLMSLVGNSVIIFILFCSRYHKQLNRVNIFIINLAIGDLAVCCITMSSELIFENYAVEIILMIDHIGVELFSPTTVLWAILEGNLSHPDEILTSGSS
ncbi:unnamed protein product [Allacma fusca]|uniref:G-protein coupled receptors family 1 profile domain-containing protein n=1 Tax=Allacma fusca TaxID=39272 RepID=A0A8J2KCQ6_9HEXA|nr:unnamed protein product [Allacma fusca]